MSGKALIESIAKGAEKLIGDNRRLRAEVERLEAAKGKLREENQRLTAQNRALEQRVAVKDLAAGFASETPGRQGTKMARARVNRLLREVDQCIVLLNKE
jgi:cell division septum initiation protein DivIVA